MGSSIGNIKITEMKPEQLAIHVDILVKSQIELTESVKEMAIQMAKAGERHEQDRKDIVHINDSLGTLTERVTTIEHERLREEQGRKFLYKHWPWMLIIAVVGTAAALNLSRSVVNDWYRSKEVPTVQRGSLGIVTPPRFGDRLQK